MEATSEPAYGPESDSEEPLAEPLDSPPQDSGRYSSLEQERGAIDESICGPESDDDNDESPRAEFVQGLTREIDRITNSIQEHGIRDRQMIGYAAYTYGATHNYEQMMQDIGAIYACKIQEVMRQVDAKMAQLLSAQLDDEGQLVFQYKPSSDDMNSNAEMATGIVRKQNQRARASGDIMDAQFDAMVQGDGFVMVGWTEYENIRYLAVNPIDEAEAAEEGNSRWTRLRRLYRQCGPTFKRITPMQVDMDPWIGKLTDQPLIVINETATLASLQTQAAQGYYDVDALKKAVEVASVVLPDAEKMRRPDGEIPDLPENSYAIRTCIRNQCEEIVLLGDVIIRCVRLIGGADAMPLFHFPNHKKPDQAYGEGDAYLLAGDQKLLNTIYSIMVTGSVFRSSPMFTGPSVANPAANGIMFTPGGYLPNDGQGAITPLAMPPAGDLGPQMVDYVRSGMQRARGISDVMSGGGRGGTATEYNGKRFTGGEMAMTDLQRHWRDSLVRMLKYEYLLNALYLEDEDAVVMGGPRASESFVTAGPGSFNDPHVQVAVDFALEDTPENQTKWLMLYKTLIGNPMINQLELVQGFVRAFGVKSKTFVIDPGKHLQRALDENAQLVSQGVIGNVLMQDDHMQHIQAHMSELAIASDPARAAQMQPHIQAHMAYLQQQQMMQQKAMSMQSNNPNMMLPQAQQNANANAEMQFGNGDRGAVQ